MAGGSAINFLTQSRNLGFEVAFLGQTGADEEGKEVKELLEKSGIKTELMTVAEGESTSVAYNMIFSHNGEFVGFHWGSASPNLSATQVDENHPLFESAAAIYFGGTAKQPVLFQ